jgi:hypothetical protein
MDHSSTLNEAIDFGIRHLEHLNASQIAEANNVGVKRCDFVSQLEIESRA